MFRRVGQVTVCALMVLVSACGGGSDADSAATATPRPPVATAVMRDGDASTDDGLVDIGGRKLYISCRGTRSPTVVYLHGMGGSAGSAGSIPSMLGDKQRMCVYDRVSPGLSDHVDGPVTGNDQVEDLHGLLAAADVPGPYVLVGASHGGLIAGMYAGTYPDDVAGMVLLDAPLPDTFKYEGRYLPDDALPKPGDWKESPEHVDDLTTIRQAQALQRQAPSIPVTYIAPKRLELPPSFPRKKITAAERRLHRDYLRRFSPGRYVLVDSPHNMEPAIPERITSEIKRLIAVSTGR